jgi:hypothetical protein
MTRELRTDFDEITRQSDPAERRGFRAVRR